MGDNSKNSEQGRSQEQLLKIFMWGLIPFISLIFTAGGAWSAFSNIETRLDHIERHIDNENKAGLPRRVQELELNLREFDNRYRSIERSVVSICVATDADCK